MRFYKMHGLGNDFVILDRRQAAGDPAPGQGAMRRIADRRRGVGCDQVILLLPATGDGHVAMQIHNPDGSAAAACGNATRCVARLLGEEGIGDPVRIETAAGLLLAERHGAGFAVDMGPVQTGWEDIPLARPMATDRLPLRCGSLSDPVGIGIGNPHAVFFVPDAEAVPLADYGPVLEHDALFPQRANIGVASLPGPDRLRLRVWERGAGLTSACGSGACAAAAAAVRRGLTGRRVQVVLDGGTLHIHWRPDGHIVMAGAAAHSFSGRLDAGLLADDRGADD